MKINIIINVESGNWMVVDGRYYSGFLEKSLAKNGLVSIHVRRTPSY